MSDGKFIAMQDGAKIYFEDQGQGQPIVLVHGWRCSTRFWKRNTPELARSFRVITIDLRGHGSSSKILTGHTIRQYAQDIREVIECLALRDASLVGWSLGGPVVLSYYQQYGHDSRLTSLGLVDTAPHPFSPAAWNSHALKGYNTDGMAVMFKLYAADPLEYARTFAPNMFKDVGSVSDQDLEWIVAELIKTPPWIAMAIYSDFLISDLAQGLPGVKIPAIVFAANSNTYIKGIQMGRHLAGRIPGSTFVPFEEAGHILFYEQPEKFNKALTDFINHQK